jgi:hypothetical protein
VAGLEDGGELIRLYPVPFRLVADTAKFKKWQWITAQIEKTSKDHRPESYRIGVDTIVCDESPISTQGEWKARREWLDKIAIFGSFAALDQSRVNTGTTLGLVRPVRMLGLDITASTPDWTDEDRQKLIQLQHQGNLFDTTDAPSIAMLRKLPFDFHYRYACPDGSGGEVELRHKIVDWEIGALYWNVRRAHGVNWEAPFRDKLERDLPSKDLMFLMGTIHRFPNQWLITSLVYPPRQRRESSAQQSLF